MRGGPGPWDSRGQADIPLGLEGRQNSGLGWQQSPWLDQDSGAGSGRYIYTYIGIDYAFWTPHPEAGSPWFSGLSRAGRIHLGSRGQAAIDLARLVREAVSMQRSYTYLGIYYAF